jgi:hypothetical protein
MMGAVVIAAAGWDHDISDWAVKEKPIYGSRNAAKNASDVLCSYAHIGMIVTSLAVPGKNEEWLFSMSKRIIWEHVGVFAAANLINPIRRNINRDRPHGGKSSFPSWHATKTASYVGMANRNVSLAKFSTPFFYSAQFILTSISAGTAWAEVESMEHYPTDVLFGVALGNFIAVLVHDAFLMDNEHNKVKLKINGEGGISLVLLMKF